jgi:tetratricopeptide (TPR) repeat protein
MKIFLSYSHADRNKVNIIRQHLEKAGFKPWIDSCELLVGDDLIERIEEGIKSSDLLIAFVSKHSVRSKWVTEELGMAIHKEVTTCKNFKVLPVRLDSTEVPFWLKKKVYLDLSNDFENELKKLLNACSEWRKRFGLDDSMSLQTQSKVLYKNGLNLREVGKHGEAFTMFDASYRLAIEIGDKECIANAFEGLGSVCVQMQQYIDAEEYLSKSLELFEQLGDKTKCALLYHHLSSIYLETGRLQQAWDFLQMALSIRKEIDDISGIATTLHELGHILVQRKQYELAIQYLEESLSYRGDPPLGYPLDYARTLTELGVASFYLNDKKTALTYLKQSLEIKKALKHWADAAITEDWIHYIENGQAGY